MAEFDLINVQSKEDPLTGRVTLTESTAFRVIMAVVALLIIAFYVLDHFDAGLPEWTVHLYGVLIVGGYLLALITFYFSRSAGTVTFSEDEIAISPKRNPDHFPSSPIDLNQKTKIRLNTMQSFRWFVTRILMYAVVSNIDGSEHRFGFMIKNAEDERQYLETLESWYRAGIKVYEHDQFGNRVFKINQGKSYEEIQKIKQEYDLDWQ